MKLAFINGSPKPDGGTSLSLIEYFKHRADLQLDGTEYTVFNIRSNFIPERDYAAFEVCDALVISSPVYCDGIPSHLLTQLEKLDEYYRSWKGSRSDARGKLKVYCMFAKGCYEGDGAKTACRIIRNWCDRCGFVWGMGIGIGGAELAGKLSIPFGHGVMRSAAKCVNRLVSAVLKLESGEDLFSNPDLPRFMFISTSDSLVWEKRAKEHNLNRRQMNFRVP